MSTLKEIIRIKGIKQRDVADILGISESRLSTLLRNEERLSEKRLAEINEAIRELAAERYVMRETVWGEIRH